jgi:4-hydroxybenzoate polyprenyltransferase
MASHAYGAVQDIIPDREGKLSSIATVLGARATVIFSFSLYTIGAVLVALQGGLSIFVAIAGLVYPLNIASQLTITDETSALARPAWRRFIWVNFLVGFVVTLVLIIATITR